MECSLSLEIHWQGNRDSWECSLRFIGREIGTHGNAVLRFIGRGIGTKASDLRINTRFRASPKAFIFIDY